MLPDKTAEETAEFAADPTIEILAMTEYMHAVKDLETGIIGINAFSGGQSLCGITFENPCSVMIEGNEIFVTDPSQTSRTVTLTFDKDITAVSETQISQKGNSVTVDMPVRGRTYSFTANGY